MTIKTRTLDADLRNYVDVRPLRVGAFGKMYTISKKYARLNLSDNTVEESDDKIHFSMAVPALETKTNP